MFDINFRLVQVPDEGGRDAAGGGAGLPQGAAGHRAAQRLVCRTAAGAVSVCLSASRLCMLTQWERGHSTPHHISPKPHTHARDKTNPDVRRPPRGTARRGPRQARAALRLGIGIGIHHFRRRSRSSSNNCRAAGGGGGGLSRPGPASPLAKEAAATAAGGEEARQRRPLGRHRTGAASALTEGQRQRIGSHWAGAAPTPAKALVARGAVHRPQHAAGTAGAEAIDAGSRSRGEGEGEDQEAACHWAGSAAWVRSSSTSSSKRGGGKWERGGRKAGKKMNE